MAERLHVVKTAAEPAVEITSGITAQHRAGIRSEKIMDIRQQGFGNLHFDRLFYGFAETGDFLKRGARNLYRHHRMGTVNPAGPADGANCKDRIRRIRFNGSAPVQVFLPGRLRQIRQVRHFERFGAQSSFRVQNNRINSILFHDIDRNPLDPDVGIFEIQFDDRLSGILFRYLNKIDCLLRPEMKIVENAGTVRQILPCTGINVGKIIGADSGTGSIQDPYFPRLAGGRMRRGGQCKTDDQIVFRIILLFRSGCGDFILQIHQFD